MTGCTGGVKEEHVELEGVPANYMCGIAGAIREGVSKSEVEGQLRLLEHRGPDVSGLFGSGPGVIGQTRLSVIDLVTGDPPMTSEQATVGAVLNGEIYNYREIRRSLLNAGHTLASQGDTEVIAHLAEQSEPVELARQLDGMFAFAVWDTSRSRLVLGRDRLGKKPLYYWSDGKSLVFASEIKALLVHPSVPRRMDSQVLPAYLTFGYVPTPRTFFEEIRSVPPAHILVFEPGTAPSLHPYWEPKLRVPGRSEVEHGSLDHAAHKVRGLLSSAVQRRLIADVPLGAFLSGGVDSSSVVALMAGLMSEPVATFTIGFDNAGSFDERPFARLVADRFRTDHTEFVVSPDAASLIERLVWHHDQPFGDSSALPTYLLSELTRRHVTVALCGDGGDELFAGYERFAAGVALSRFQRLPSLLQRCASDFFAALPGRAFSGRARSLQRFVDGRDLPVPEAYLSWVSYVPAAWRSAMCPDGSPWGLADYLRIWDTTASAEVLDRLLFLNMRTYLLDDLLPKVDRMSMAHGLEVRSPFLDIALLEHAVQLAPSTKLRGLSLKRVLKHAMSDLLPPEVLRRRKRGFALPLDSWFRNELRGYLEARLLPSSARARVHLRGEAVDRLVGEHLSGVSDHGHALWTLLTLEEFLRRQGW
ncbi:MAG: asparagine synthase (glutamine-hydrolyzing) [Acidimicrobiales bacterium]|jgi:asparagine synthase (glutamine-hydrolysing)